MSQLLVSFTLLVGHDDLLAAQTLVHLFRTAQEAASAEFLLITGSRDILKGSSMAQRYPLLHSVSLQLLSAFGVNVRQVHSTRSGPWAEAQAGMEAAAGTYVVLVRAGTLPLAGWLHTLLDTFAAHPRAAALGPLVLSPSGQVLEAGGLLASNASPALLGSGGLPAAAPALLHLRHVDFVGAGAVLALRREAALAAGGFDHRLQLYLGDVDLGMALRQQGHHVLVQPLSVVVARQPSYSRIPAKPSDQAQAFLADQQLVASKWEHALQLRHCPPAAVKARLAALTRATAGRGVGGRNSRSQWGPRVLWIDDTVPTPDKDSGSVRALGLLKILVQEGYQVSFQPRREAWRGYNLALSAAGVQVLPAGRLVLRAPMRNGGNCMYDAFLVARRSNYNKTRDVLGTACPGVPQILDTVDLHFLREARDELLRRGLGQLRALPALLSWLDSEAPELALTAPGIAALLRRRDGELGLIAKAQAVLVVSQEELEGLLFVGNFNHHPNVDAALYLVEHLLPRIRGKLPQAKAAHLRAHLVGSGAIPPHALRAVRRHQRWVQFHGYLTNDELGLLYAGVKVVVAPLTSGAGVKGKVNQAMKLAVPVVATSIALEGLHARDGVDCLVADKADDFADKVVAAYENCTLWRQLSLGGSCNVRRHFSLEAARAPLLKALAQVGLPVRLPTARVDCGGGPGKEGKRER
ncbi:hypothetical protein N2152v2_001936 [Parachlorella kessleri]